MVGINRRGGGASGVAGTVVALGNSGVTGTVVAVRNSGVVVAESLT